MKKRYLLIGIIVLYIFIIIEAHFIHSSVDMANDYNCFLFDTYEPCSLYSYIFNLIVSTPFFFFISAPFAVFVGIFIDHPYLFTLPYSFYIITIFYIFLISLLTLKLIRKLKSDK